VDQDGAGGVSLGFAAQPSACRPFRHAVDLLQGSTLLTAIQPRVVVAACVIEDGAVLAARRTGPPELAGKWELPGGKVEPGETDEQAVRRELAEELRVDAIVGGRIGHDVDLGDNTILRCYRVELAGAGPVPAEHDVTRWLAAMELEEVDWLPADRHLLGDLRLAMSDREPYRSLGPSS